MFVFKKPGQQDTDHRQLCFPLNISQVATQAVQPLGFFFILFFTRKPYFLSRMERTSYEDCIL